MRLIRVISCGIAMSFSGISMAAGDIHGGMWEVRLEPQMSGVPMQMPAQTKQQCLKDDASVAKMQGEIPKDCDVKSNFKGKKISWTFSCKSADGGEVKGGGNVQFTGDQFSGEASMHIQGMSITTKMTGRRIGKC